MTYRSPRTALLAVVLLLGDSRADEPLRSGPQVGAEIPGSFNPLNVTGEDAGQKRCLV
jgi:hypothetical protein